MKRIKKLLISAIALLLLILSGLQSVSAEEPYKTFTIDGDKKFTETQTAYLPEGRLVQFGTEMLSQPEDMKIYQNKIYIADTGNSRVIVSTPQGELVNIIGESILKKPMGISVVNDKIYVADESLAQVIEFNMEGEVQYIFERPQHPSFGKTAPFTPIKVTADERDNIYVISRGNSNGLIQLNKNTPQEFLGYFAPNMTSISFLTSFRKMIFTEDQLSRMLNIIPNSPVNLTMDKEGLIYTITPQDNQDGIKKLNMAGLKLVSSSITDRQLSSITIGPYENIFVLSSNGYIYEFNRNLDLLFVFGGKDVGQQRLGLFSQASAIDVDESNTIYVLDQTKGEIQYFKSTEFSDKVHEALILYQNGFYIESKEIWEEVLKVNSLFNFANLGMGEAFFKEENYDDALASYSLSRNVPGYSDAYWELRNVQIRENIIPFLGLALGAFLAIKVFKKLNQKYQFKIYNKIKSWFKNNKLYQELNFALYFMKHPIDGSYGIKKERKTSNLSVLILATLALIVWVLSKYFTGFIFSTVNQGEYTVFTDVIITVVAFLFIVSASYLVMTINDGKSSFRHLIHGFVYSLTPYIIINPILVFISNYLTLNEAFVLSFSHTIIIAWVLTLLFVSIRELNNYESKETIRIILLSLFTIFIGILIIFVIYILMNQMISFFQAVFREAVYRFEQR